MQPQRIKSLGLYLAAAILTAAASEPVFAALVLPPGTSLPVPTRPTAPSGAPIATVTSPFSNADISGSLVTSVFTGDPLNPFGAAGLTFQYVLTRSTAVGGSAGDPLTRLSLNSWGTFLAAEDQLVSNFTGPHN